MTRTQIFESIIQNRGGDSWIVIPPVCTAPAILAEYESIDIPESWDFLGRIFKFVKEGDDLVIDQAVDLWPNRLNLATWRREHDSYFCQVRLVPYIKEGTLRLFEVTPNQRTTKTWAVGGESASVNIAVYPFDGVNYWGQADSNSSPTYLEFTLSEDWVIGKYNLVIAGRDAPNVNAELQFSVSGVIVGRHQLDSPSLVSFETQVLTGFTFRPGMVLRIDITTQGADKGLLKFVRLNPF